MEQMNRWVWITASLAALFGLLVASYRLRPAERRLAVPANPAD
jgi:hypothetical protein